MKFQQIVAKLDHVKPGSNGTVGARCPSHHDKQNSLSVTPEADRILVYCHAGCSPEKVCAAIGIEMRDLFYEPRNENSYRPPDASYEIRDLDGNLIATHQRINGRNGEGKRMWWERNGRKDLGGMPVTSIPLYGAHLTHTWPDNSTTVVAEGEKCADRLRRMEVRALGTVCGAPKVPDDDQLQVLTRFQEVILWPDRDDPGLTQMRGIALRLLALGVTPDRLRWLDPARVEGLAEPGDDCADLNDNQVRNALNSAVGPLPEDGSGDRPTGSTAQPPSRDWEAPEEIVAEILPVPALTPALIPAGLRPWIVDVAERQQCPLEFPIVAALVAASSLVGRTLGIRPKREDDWLVIPNLWGAAVARSGTLKTPALNEGMAPINYLRTKAEKQFKDDLVNYKFTSTVNEARKDDLAKQMRAALKEGKDPEILKAAFDDIQEDKPIEKRYVTNDTTVEKLGELLNENPRGLMVYRDELIGFLSSLERRGRECDRAFYLEAWNGNGRFDYDRIMRGTVHIQATTVALLGGIQPAPLEAYLRETFADGRDDGLIQRFQLAVYPDTPAHWVNVDRQPNTLARKVAIETFAALDALLPTTVGAVIEEGHQPYVRFTTEAQVLFDAWRARLEEKLRSADEHPVMAAHLAKYRSLMPSLALLFELIGGFVSFDGGGYGLISEKWLEAQGGRIVSKDSALMAIAWCEFLEQHARRIYQGVVFKLQNLVASLASKIRAGKLPDPFTARAVYRHEWTGLTDPEMVLRVLDVLEDANWIRALEVKDPAGGRSTTLYRVNPAIPRPQAEEEI